MDEKTIRALEERVIELRRLVEEDGVDLQEELSLLEKKLAEIKREYYTALSDWDRVKLARHPERPSGLSFVEALTDAFYELRGDRAFGDDPALRGGLARIDDWPMVIAFHHRGRTPDERKTCRFGMATPQGYRKAIRLMGIAQRLRLPFLTLIDTPGAYPGVEAEAQNIAGVIAECIAAQLSLPVPTLAVILGEGGSGGAVALAAADRVLILENATYSVISPEGAAAILWKDAAAAPQAAQALKLTAPHLLALGVVDEVIPEPPGGAHTDPAATVQTVREAILRHLGDLGAIPLDELVKLRYNRYRNAGSRSQKD